MGIIRHWCYFFLTLAVLGWAPGGDLRAASGDSPDAGEPPTYASPLATWMASERDEAQHPDELSELLELSRQRRLQAHARADSLGLPVRREIGDQVKELQFFRDGLPHYHVTHNLNAAITTSTDKLWSASGPFALTGSGVTLGIWDGGRVMTNHQELIGRVIQRDGATTLSNHATHVGGTMMSAGLASQSRGMAYAANLDAHDWNDDVTQMFIAAGDGMRVSNHSYGFLAGWHWSGSVWRWYGHHEETEARGFGAYDESSWEWDMVARLEPHYLIVKAAGNSRGQGPSMQPVIHEVMIDGEWVRDSTTVREVGGGDDGFDCLPYHSVAKNILTVGAIFHIDGGYSEPADVQMPNFSSWGPTNDGRIKPDLVASGIELYSTSSQSTNHYTTMSGTSMAAPVVSGTVGLLLQQYNQTYGHDAVSSATMKGLLIHTADQASPHAGPDYSHGWGVLNAHEAARVISRDASKGKEFLIRELTLHEGDTIHLPFWASGEEPLRATIAWIDPPGDIPPSSLNPPDLVLVNDLDMRLIDSEGNSHKPYILDPANPAQPAATGDNFRDNVEQIFIPDAAAGNTYTLQITHKGALEDGRQDVSLIITGVEQATTFTGPGEQWDDPENWTNGVPETGDHIILSSEGTASLHVEEARTATNIYIEDGALLTIGAHGALDVKGNIYAENDAIPGILIRSTTEGTGSLIHHTPGIPIEMESHVDAHVRAQDAASLLSAPVAGQSFASLVASHDLDQTLFSRWDEVQGDWQSLWDEDDGWLQDDLLPGSGYLYDGDPGPVISYRGHATVADLSPGALSITPGTGEGWHLLGNPFAAGLHWDVHQWQLSGIAHTAKIWQNGGYVDLPAGEGIIPPAHAFFVQAFDEANALTIPEAARTHDSIAEVPADEARLRMMVTATEHDAQQQSLVRLTHEASEGFDTRFDSHFLEGLGPVFYSVKDGIPLSTLALPSDADDLRLRFYFHSAEPGREYTLHLLDNNIDVPFYLYDKHTGELHDLDEDRPYGFVASANQHAWPRFELHITSSFIPTGTDEPTEPPHQVWYHSGELHYAVDDLPARITIYAVDGRQIASHQLASPTGSIPAPVRAGIYLAEISTNGSRQVTRILVQ